jgi:hypothetical protein
MVGRWCLASDRQAVSAASRSGAIASVAAVAASAVASAVSAAEVPVAAAMSWALAVAAMAVIAGRGPFMGEVIGPGSA